jgi:hypothetical protein
VTEQRASGTEAVDPDPNVPEEGQPESTLGGRTVPGEQAGTPGDADPTAGGRQGMAGDADPATDPNAASIAADEPTDGGPAIPVAGGAPGEEPDEVPHADPTDS